MPGLSRVPTAVVDAWLDELLHGDLDGGRLGDLGVDAVVNAAGEASGGADGDEMPQVDRYVVFSLADARDVRAAGAPLARVASSLVYDVKAVVHGSNFDPASAIFDRATELLETADTVLVEWEGASHALTCHRETLYRYPELQDGAHLRHLGGTFRIRVTES